MKPEILGAGGGASAFWHLVARLRRGCQVAEEGRYLPPERASANVLGFGFQGFGFRVKYGVKVEGQGFRVWG